jgi:TrmH family RNA methyltransferase
MSQSSEVIDNPGSTRVKRIIQLFSSRERKKIGKFVVEGPQAVREAVHYRAEFIDDIYVDEAVAGKEPAAFIVEKALEKNIYIHTVTSKVFATISTDAQGIIAVVKSDAVSRQLPQESEHDGEHGGEFDVTSLFTVCWQVRDPGNAGTVIRTSDAAGCKAVILLDQSVDVLNPKVVRATAGSLFHIPVVTMSSAEFFAWARDNRVQVWAADLHGSSRNPPIPLSPALAKGHDSPLAMLFGNEARGLPIELVEQADESVVIPIYGKAESLNLASSVAVIVYTLSLR